MESSGGLWSWTAVVVVDERRRAVRELLAPPADGILRTLLTEPVSAIPAGASTVVAEAGLVRSAAGCDPAFSQLADWDLWLRLAQRAPGTACPEVLVAYVQHAESMLLTDPRPLLQEYARLARQARGARGARGHGLGRAPFLALGRVRSPARGQTGLRRARVPRDRAPPSQRRRRGARRRCAARRARLAAVQFGAPGSGGRPPEPGWTTTRGRRA